MDPISQIGVLAFANTVAASSPPAAAAAAAAAATVPVQASDSDPPNTSRSDLRFNGRLFVRWKASGHLLLSNYLGLHSILDTVEARRYSRLRRYIGGSSPN
ncbi:hypothetical protein CBS101457_005957 [Exobasidium rhododendri]|nr:hypothetical protein CBS101457_005957 [Exobasidium rhododendri]